MGDKHIPCGTEFDAPPCMHESRNVGRLSWRESGNGEALLFVHAFPFDGGMWEDQLSGVDSDWRKLAVDLPGFGDSPRRDGVSSIDAFADDVAEMLEQSGARRAVVCGLSMGGYVTLALHRRHPERVRAMILCDTRASADTAEGRIARLTLAQRTRHSGMQPIVEEMLPRMISMTTRLARPALVSRIETAMRATRPESAATALTAMAHRADSTPMLRDIEVPTLVIVGAEDQITPPGESQMLTRAIRGARIEIVENAGHLTNFEQPDAFNRLLNSFLATLPVHAPL